MKLDAFETYCLFMALRNHFTQKRYCYFKYRGKIKTTKESFMIHRDRFKYSKLSRKYDAVEMRDFIVANLLEDKKWIGDLLESSADTIYTEYKKRKQALTYTFTSDVSRLFDSLSDPKEAFKCKRNCGEYPRIIDLHLNQDLSIETLAILNSFIHFADRFDDKIGEDDIIWAPLRLKVFKLTPFLDYDREKFKDILRRAVTLNRSESSPQLESA